jgi:phosphoenolpyruvate-protein phosphotransferase
MRCLLKGLPASSGIAIGPVWIHQPIHISVEKQQAACNPQSEWNRLETGLVLAKSQIEFLHQKALEMTGTAEAEIFQAHALFLEDPDLLSLIKDTVFNEKVNAEYAVDTAIDHYAQMLLNLEGEYFQARAADVRDVGRRILYCLSGIQLEDIKMPDEPVVIIAEDLTPSDTVQFDRSKILGFCTVKGGSTSHTAILARGIGVPAVVSAPMQLNEIRNGILMMLDGTTGEVIINPEKTELAVYQKKQSEGQAHWIELLEGAQKPAVTRDGKQVEIVANIGGVEDACQAVKWGAEGVGLLRTEFLYLDRQSMPTEEEQTAIYKAIFEVMGQRPVVVRTLDIGGDKSVSYLGIKEEANPFLGWRAIRMINECPEILHSQFRALLRAGVGTDLRIMLPMVSNLEEVQQAREIFDDASKSLLNEGLKIAEHIQFGIMIEVPSAAIIATHLADLVDFFSIGTNDLTQYTLAVDRTNERVAKLASPFNPAVIHLINTTIRAAHAKGKWVGLCGEMAGDPLGTPLLLGLGLDEFSMAPKSIPGVKQLVRRLSEADCKIIAEHALGLSTAASVEKYLKEAVTAL